MYGPQPDQQRYRTIGIEFAMNPHDTMDGPWGGWGPSEWFRGPEFGFQSWDVLERLQEGVTRLTPKGTWIWKRIWIHTDKAWRDLTVEEISKLPDPNTI